MGTVEGKAGNKSEEVGERGRGGGGGGEECGKMEMSSQEREVSKRDYNSSVNHHVKR